MTLPSATETELTIGPEAIIGYSRLPYTMWYALAEFIDNSTQSRLNYSSIIDDVLRTEGTPLVVSITYDHIGRTLTVEDNSIGMTDEDLRNALRIAQPTTDSRGRSKYGMGMKTAACWIGSRWTVTTCEWSSGVEWTALVDVNEIVRHGSKIPLTPRAASPDRHYTKLMIEGVTRRVQKKTEETLQLYLGSMYQFDLLDGSLKILFNGEPILPPSNQEMDTDPSGKIYKQDFKVNIGDKEVTGWFGVLKKGGRQYGGFSLFQNKRQIMGLPNAWKPRSIFGGVDAEGANNLVAQRLTGMVLLDGFDVSHTKDAILFQDDEEEDLENFLRDATKEYREYAVTRRRPSSSIWTAEKFKDLVDAMTPEFASPEIKDAVVAPLPPIEMILKSNQKQAETLTPEEKIAAFNILEDLTVTVAVQDRSENDQYVIIAAGAAKGTMTVIFNRLHPYYQSLETDEALSECFRQYIFDAVAEYRLLQQQSKLNPDSLRRLKDHFLRIGPLRVENEAVARQELEAQRLQATAAQKS